MTARDQAAGQAAGGGAQAVLDGHGWPIVPGARVHVPERPGLGGCGIVPGFGGLVIGASPGCVEIEEFLTFARRSIHPSQVSVQRGESKSSAEHDAIRRGGTAYLRQRIKRIQEREARAAARLGREDEGGAQS